MDNYRIWDVPKIRKKTTNIEKLILNDDMLELFFFTDNVAEKVKLSFKSNVAAYQIIEESYDYRRTDELHSRYGEEFVVDNTFFIVDESVFLHQIKLSNKQITDKFFHFAVSANYSYIDVITDTMPEVIILK